MATDPMDELRAMVAAMPPEQATVQMLLFLFPKLVEIEAALDMLIPVIGGMAGKLGIRDEALRRLIDMGMANNSKSTPNNEE